MKADEGALPHEEFPRTDGFIANIANMTARILWKSDANWEATDRVHKKVDDLLATMADRGPDPDYPHGSPNDRLLLELVRELRRPTNGHGSVHGSRRDWLRDAAILVILGLSAWTLKATIDNAEDIAVLKCQLNTTCSQAVPHAAK